MQEALPAQIHVVYIIQPGQFWQKKQTSRGHSKEKAKLEFSVSASSTPGSQYYCDAHTRCTHNVMPELKDRLDFYPCIAIYIFASNISDYAMNTGL